MKTTSFPLFLALMLATPLPSFARGENIKVSSVSKAQARIAAKHVHGRFSGTPLTAWISPPGEIEDNMVLLSDFWYQDPFGKRWSAPKGLVIDGASIPRALWSIVGSPYTGSYRKASIVHDYACDTERSAAQRLAADVMFRYACMDGGCTEAESNRLYAGVRVGSVLATHKETPKIYSDADLRALTNPPPATESTTAMARPPFHGEMDPDRDLEVKFRLIVSEVETLKLTGDQDDLTKIDRIVTRRMSRH